MKRDDVIGPGETRKTSEGGQPSKRVSARWLVIAAGGLLLLIASPVVVQGAPLADDYVSCMRPVNQGGYGRHLEEIWRYSGVVRPAQILEFFVIAGTCRTVPFGLVILVPLTLKFAVALLLYLLLRDLDLRSPWPEIGTAIWLLEPLGTEAALWPSALHVPLGLALALLALRLYRRDRPWWATLAALGACLCVEQVIFALPVAVWLTSSEEQRRRSTAYAGALVSVVLITYATLSGTDPRQAMTLSERLQSALTKGEWYFFFPAAGLGLYSGALGFLWALPYSIAIVIAGALGGATMAPRLLSGRSVGSPNGRVRARSVILVCILIALINLPLIVTDVGYSARTFTPTWLVLSAAAAAAGARVGWRRPYMLGVFGGTFAAFAVLSLALSVSVRVRTADFDRAAAYWIAGRVPNGGVVAVCDVGRTVVELAPLGAYHLHEFQHEWASWIQYYTDRRVTVRRSGLRYWGSRCPNLNGADLIVDFPDLVRDLTG
jgi:hypothetical protein